STSTLALSFSLSLPASTDLYTLSLHDALPICLPTAGPESHFQPSFWVGVLAGCARCRIFAGSKSGDRDSATESRRRGSTSSAELLAQKGRMVVEHCHRDVDGFR